MKSGSHHGGTEEEKGFYFSPEMAVKEALHRPLRGLAATGGRMKTATSTMPVLILVPKKHAPKKARLLAKSGFF